MISTAARAKAAHTHPDNPGDELAGATAAVDTGAEVGAVGAADAVPAAPVPAVDVPTAPVPTAPVPAVDVPATGGVPAAAEPAPLNWNLTSPVTG